MEVLKVLSQDDTGVDLLTNRFNDINSAGNIIPFIPYEQVSNWNWGSSSYKQS